MTALVRRECAVVLALVLGHQHQVSAGVTDEVGIAAAHQSGDVRFEGFASDARVERDQQLALDGATGLVDADPRNARADVQRWQAASVPINDFGREAAREGATHDLELVRDVALHFGFDRRSLGTHGGTDRLAHLFAQLAAPFPQFGARRGAVELDLDAHGSAQVGLLA